MTPKTPPAPLRHRRGATRARSILALLALCGLLAAADAWACGGCFVPPPINGSAPVLQDAERILFVRDAKTKKSTVWVEVRYSGPPGQFGWVLPLPKMPQVGVGTSYLFDALAEVTAPRVDLTSASAEGCGAAFSGGGGCSDASAPAATSGGEGYGGIDRGGGVEVLHTAQAGPYDYQIIAGKSADGVLAWLNARGYAIPAKAKGVLDDHVKQGHVFVAVKLAAGAGVREIKPISLTMDDAEPCVPLRLTSIAAVEDTLVQVWLAGPGRAIPKNHLHVALNPLRLDLLGGLGNYGQVLAQAIDEAGGRAFVTEFAGAFPSAAQRRSQGSSALQRVPAMTLAGLEKTQSRCGFLQQLWKGQVPAHPDLLNILEKHMHLAAELKVDIDEAYTIATGCAGIAPLPFDPTPVIAELQGEFLAPLQTMHAAVQAASQAGGAAGRLTRLTMRLSPDEMTKDPVFSFAAQLPDVSPVIAGSYNLVCAGAYGSTRLTLPGLGSWILANQLTTDPAGAPRANNALDPRFSSAPAALRVELLDEVAAPLAIHPADVPLVDAAIAGAHWNEPALPAGIALKTAPVRWTPPVGDARLLTYVDNDGGSCAGLPRAPRSWVVAGLLALAAVLVLARRRRAPLRAKR